MATNFPGIDDYVKGSDGKYYNRNEIKNNPNAIEIDPNASDTSAGATNIWENLKGQGNALLGTVQNELSKTDTAKSLGIQNSFSGASEELKQDALRNAQKANAYSRDYMDVTKLNTPSDYLKYGGFNLANFGAQALPMVLASPIPGAVPTIAGLQNIAGQNYRNIQDEGNYLSTEQNAVSGTIGAIAGKLSTQGLLGKYGQASTRTGNIAMQVPFQTAVGLSQNVANLETLGKDIGSEESKNELINTAVGGALGGLVAGGLQGRRPNETPIRNNEPTIEPVVNRATTNDNATNTVTTNPVVTPDNTTSPKNILNNLNEDIKKTINTPKVDETVNNITEDNPLLINKVEYKPNTDGLKNTNIDAVNSIGNIIKNEDNTVSQEKMNMVNNLIEASKISDENADGFKLFNNVKKIIAEKGDNFTDEDARSLNVKINTVLKARNEEVSTPIVEQAQSKVIDNTSTEAVKNTPEVFNEPKTNIEKNNPLNSMQERIDSQSKQPENTVNITEEQNQKLLKMQEDIDSKQKEVSQLQNSVKELTPNEPISYSLKERLQLMRKENINNDKGINNQLDSINKELEIKQNELKSLQENIITPVNEETPIPYQFTEEKQRQNSYNQRKLELEQAFTDDYISKKMSSLMEQQKITKEELADNPFFHIDNIKEPEITPLKERLQVKESFKEKGLEETKSNKGLGFREKLKEQIFDPFAEDLGHNLNRESNEYSNYDFEKDFGFNKKPNVSLTGNSFLFSQGFKNRLESLTSQQVYDYIKQAQEITPLSTKEKLELSNIENSIKSIKDNVNIEILVIPEKFSPYNDGANGWFDEKNNRIVLVGTESTKAKLQSTLFHELWHGGISKTVNENGMEYVSKKFNELYTNKLVKAEADINIAKGMEKNLAIEEAIGSLTENGILKQSSPKFFERIMKTVKDIINKIIGKDMEMSDQDVFNFFKKTTDSLFENTQQERELTNTANSVFKFSSRNDDEFRNLRTSFENRTQLDKLKSDWDILKQDSDIKEALDKTGGGRLGKFGKLIRTQHDILTRFGGKMIYNIKGKQNDFEGNLINKYQQNSINMNKIVKNDKLSKSNIDTLTTYLGKMAYDENNGSGKRVSETEIRAELAGKVTPKQLDSLVSYAKEFRESADNNIYLKAVNESIGLMDNIMSGLKKTNKDTAEKIEATIMQASKNDLKSDNPDVITIRNLGDKINEIITQDSSKLSTETLETLKPIIDNINKTYEVAQSRESYGYIPKDFTGKFVTTLTDKATGKVLLVLPNEKEMDNAVLYKQLKNKYKDSNMFSIDTYSRSEPISSSFDINKAISEMRKNDITFSEEQLKQFASLGQVASEYQRTYKGQGYNTKLANVVHNSAYKEMRQASGKYLNSNVYDFINSFEKNSVERNVFTDVIKQMDKNQDVSQAPLDKKLRGIRSIASTFALALNFANSTAQIFQSTLLGLGNGAKYGQVFNTKVAESNKLIRNGMKSNDPMTQKVIDDLRNNDLLGSSMTKQLSEDIKKYHEKGVLDNMKDKAFAPNEAIERRLRMGTLLRSIDVYKQAMNDTLPNKELAKQIREQDVTDFVRNELATVNGDFSKINRSAILEGEFAQTLLMFQQWKAMTLEAFQQMDGKGKAIFIVGNVMAGGVLGFPFAQDGLDIIDFFAKLLGKNMPAKSFVNNMIKDIAGDNQYAQNALRFGALPQVGEKVGLGQLIPSLKGINEIAQGQVAQGFKDSFGPASNFITNIVKTTGQLGGNVLSGNIENVPNTLIGYTPTFVKNTTNAVKGLYKGYNTDSNGNKIFNNIDSFDATLMAFGSNSFEKNNEKYNQQLLQTYTKNFSDIRNGYINKAKTALLNNDTEKLSETISEAQLMGFNVDIASIIKQQVQGDTGTKRILSNLPLRERIKAMQDLRLNG